MAGLSPGAASSAGNKRGTPSATRTARANATPNRCAPGITPRARTSAASPAPSSPPTLNSAWNVDMIGRPYRSSTATHWTLIATSIAPMQAPKIGRTRKSSGTVGTLTSSGRTTQKSPPATTITARLPHRATICPPNNNAPTEPAATASNARPRVASLNPNFRFTSGICATHEAIPTPFTRKIANSASRVARNPGEGSTCHFAASPTPGTPHHNPPIALAQYPSQIGKPSCTPDSSSDQHRI